MNNTDFREELIHDLKGIFQPGQRIVFFDLEITAWQGSLQRKWSAPGEEREIVEIGAVLTTCPAFEIEATFNKIVRPVLNPVLSRYFMDLTGITQDRLLTDGVPLQDAMAAYKKFAAPAEVMVSNGIDGVALHANSQLLRLDWIFADTRFLNVRPAIGALLSKPDDGFSTGDLPGLFGLENAGTLHSATDDAIALCRTFQVLRHSGTL